MDSSITLLFAKALCLNEKLRPLFANTGTIPNITPDQEAEARAILNRIDESKTATLRSVLQEWTAYQNCQREETVEKASAPPPPTTQWDDPLCNGPLWNPQTKKFMDILKPLGGRKKKVEFDPYEFLLNKIQNQEGIPLHFRSDLDNEDILDLLYSDNRERRDQISDANIRKLAELLYVLNNDSSYRILDYQNEKMTSS